MIIYLKGDLMITIESLKDYTNLLDEEEFLNLAIQIYKVTNFMCKDYPNYKNWYFEKQLSSIKDDERNIFFIRNPKNKNEIIAVSSLKRNNEEKKICTLYVIKEFRGLGIGSKLIEKSLKWLNTKNPVFTFPDYKLEIFKPIIEKYNWELTEVIDNLYNEGIKELCFNGKTLNTIKKYNI